MLSVLAAIAATLVPSAHAATQPTAAPTATCYGGSHSWGLNMGNDEAPHYMPNTYWVTSSRCQDINLRITGYGSSRVTARVCFIPYGSPRYCNTHKWFYRGDTAWRMIASDVRDGTRFQVELDFASGYYSGYIAY
jgi:hypothetical protein